MVLSLLSLFTCSKRHIGKFLSSCGILLQVALWVKLHPLVPGVTQAMVYSGRHTHLMTSWNGVACNVLRGIKHRMRTSAQDNSSKKMCTVYI